MNAIPWNGPPINVLGVGPNPARDLPNHLKALLDQSELIIGAQRHLDGIGLVGARTIVYPSPFSGLEKLLRASTGKRVTLLASGDPLLFGIGTWLRKHLPGSCLRFHPNVSAIQAAFGAIGLPWHDAKIISLHGRPMHRLLTSLRMNRRYAVLTDADNHPAAIAGFLEASGFGQSTVWVAEDLGTTSEQVRKFSVQDLVVGDPGFSPLNVVILEARGPGGVVPEFPGIPDECFSTGKLPGHGMLSKREVRLAALSLLQPRAGEVGWDVGAGCGGLCVEWALWSQLSTIYAVEKHADRLEHLRANRDRFGVSGNLEIITGEAPNALLSLPDPDAVYLGGNGGRLDALLEHAWSRLRPGGRLVSAAVTEESRSALLGFAPSKSPELTELRVARGSTLGRQTVLRPLLPVLLGRLVKS